MPKKTVYETNFDRLVKLNICTAEGELRPDGRSKAEGYMDLVLEQIDAPGSISDKKCKTVSLAHYFTQNGDLCCDPDMVLMVYPKTKMVEVCSFQMAIPPIYQEVYPEPGRYVPNFKKELNRFLKTWLTNLISQDHGVIWESQAD